VSGLLLVGVPLAIPLVMFAVIHFEWFVVLGVLGSIFFPASLAQPGGFNVDIGDLFLVLAAAAWIVNFGVGRAPLPHLDSRRYYISALLFWFVNFLSVAWSVHKSATLGFSVQLAELLFAYPIIMSSLPKSVKNLRIGGYLMLLISVGLALATMAELATGHGSIADGTSINGFGKNPLGSFIAAGAVYGVAQLFSSLSWRARGVLSVVILLDILGTLASGSRGALLGMVGALLVVVLLLGHGRVTRIVLALMVAGALAGVYFFVIAPQKQAVLSESGAYSSSQLRITTWRYGLHEIGLKPWLGSGARTFNEAINGGTLPDPNNLFLLTWDEVGIPGMVTLVALLVAIGALIRRIGRLPVESLAIGAGAAGIIVSLLLHFQVDVSWSRGESTLVYAMTGVILCLFRLAAQPQAAPVAVAPAADLREPQPA
jgi:O-antigen ligase